MKRSAGFETFFWAPSLFSFRQISAVLLASYPLFCPKSTLLLYISCFCVSVSVLFLWKEIPFSSSRGSTSPVSQSSPQGREPRYSLWEYAKLELAPCALVPQASARLSALVGTHHFILSILDISHCKMSVLIGLGKAPNLSPVLARDYITVIKPCDQKQLTEETVYFIL